MVTLPTPPSDAEKYLYVSQDKARLYLFGGVSLLFLLAGMFGFARYFGWYWPIALIIGGYLFVSYLIGIFSPEFDLNSHKRVVGADLKEYPTVDVFLPSCGEPLPVLQNTYEHVGNLDYPEAKLSVYVLDDAGSDEVQKLCARYGYAYIRRPNLGEMKKAGNLRHAFTQTTGDLILILDADFSPRPDMLRELVPYFVDPKVGIVQTPQYFRVLPTQSWVEKGAGFVQELFYRLIQVNRDHFGAAICVGTSALYRREALAPMGGTAAIPYSEDLHTGVQVIEQGYRLRYIPINLSTGLCPSDLSSFFNQMYRWATGSTSLLFTRSFWKNDFNWKQRSAYITGMTYYWATSLELFTGALPSIYLLIFHPQHIYWWGILFSLPSLLYGTAYMAYWSNAKWGFYAMRSRHAAYYAHLFAIWDFITGRTQAWTPTGAAKKTQRYKHFRILCAIKTSLYTGLIVGLMTTRLVQGYPVAAFIPLTLITILNAAIGYSCMIEPEEAKNG